MKSRNQIGAAHVSVLVAAVMTVLFFLTLVMALVFFMGKSDLQKNIDTKVEEQLATETTKIEAKKESPRNLVLKKLTLETIGKLHYKDL